MDASAEPDEAAASVASSSEPLAAATKPTRKSKPTHEPAPAGETALVPAPLPATLSVGDMGEALAAAKRASRTCGTQHPGSLLTTVSVEIVVSPSGAVKSAKALAPVSGTPVGSCAEKAIKGQRFPASQSGARHTVSLPVSG